ncbi:MAG: alpha/beta hydrolase [Bacteroidaceae bacterium]|nr:alpha/beta hydrolase [Bacteroidaceae bacterium]
MQKGVFLILMAMATLPSFSARRGLSREECVEVQEQVINSWMAREREAGNAILALPDSARAVSSSLATMPFWYKVYGSAPKGKRTLWISLHGGGGVPQEVNDGQWDNQKRLYQPEEGVYVAPRAPWNAWNMWCQEPIDELYEQLIRLMVACEGVDPDRVYLMGYSAGGDGVWREAPRMADHWAAASMMAGHPGDVSLVNLRNMPFMIWCGANDAAYQRNVLCAQRGEQMDSLQRDCPEGYIHQTHIMQGKGHWMDREDRIALPWMRRHIRNPYPKSVVWQQEEVVRPTFYWLQAPAGEQVRGRRVDVTIVDNTILLTRCDYTSITLWLNDDLLNLDKKVTVKSGKRTLFRGRIPRTEANMQASLAERGDPRYCFPAKITVSLKEH